MGKNARTLCLAVTLPENARKTERARRATRRGKDRVRMLQFAQIGRCEFREMRSILDLAVSIVWSMRVRRNSLRLDLSMLHCVLSVPCAFRPI